MPEADSESFFEGLANMVAMVGGETFQQTFWSRGEIYQIGGIASIREKSDFEAFQKWFHGDLPWINSADRTGSSKSTENE